MILGFPARCALLIILFVAVLTPGRAESTMTLQTANDVFAAGNAFYRAQKYEEAHEAYSELVRSGYETAPVLYNMGTVDARLGSKTQAMAYLTRAKKMRPRDDDIRANLAFVKPATTNAKKQDDATANSLWNRIYGYFSADEWLAMVWVALMLTCCGGAVLFLWRSEKIRIAGRTMIWLGCVSLFIIAAPAANQIYKTRIVKRAIVARDTEMLSGPAGRFTRVSNLTEGQVVRRLGHKTADYRQVRMENGLQGYAKRDALMRL